MWPMILCKGQQTRSFLQGVQDVITRSSRSSPSPGWIRLFRARRYFQFDVYEASNQGPVDGRAGSRWLVFTQLPRIDREEEKKKREISRDDKTAGKSNVIECHETRIPSSMDVEIYKRNETKRNEFPFWMIRYISKSDSYEWIY